VRDRGLEGRRRDDIRPGLVRRIFPVTDANLARMLEGRAPRDASGRPIVLHHRGQYANYFVDEYTVDEHRRLPLHEPGRDSSIDRTVFAEQRARYWVTRARKLLHAP
jgi:hypothetical protein